ncbi:protein of unknown function (DUF349) [Bernardetia litoralis DSM 6794]|uniref:DUF349 domain-containing protein n=1 Tax=Bernardetia litoralis (strain ATCC 23117 / DSM 6794 / NBRC 15988 / NCIMB 1366 / Fx l1 / Sio-4) TaxID=880071 RepID=I4APD8_BERLS|nr:DUF349 domain-containing protein [Bernardetia litoralis]AFM05823.1 protein of unknown function (DUF349) [Bernardetia litoralis DSM 6794]
MMNEENENLNNENTEQNETTPNEVGNDASASVDNTITKDIIQEADDEVSQEDLDVIKKESEETNASDDEKTDDTESENSAKEQKEEKQELPQEDYSILSKEELVAKAAMFAAQATVSEGRINFRYLDDQVSKIREFIDAFTETERKEARQKYEESATSEEEKEGFSFQQDELTGTFYENFKAIKEAKRTHYAKLEGEKQSNLKKKQAIIEELRSLTDTSKPSELSRKGEFDRVKAIQTEFKNIGYVPMQEADEIYRNFKALLDLFYNQKSQERELLALDRQRNLEAKVLIVARAEELLNHDKLNDAVNELNRLHQEYKRIGPVPRADREELWERFKVASDKIYDARREYADKFKAQLEENMKLKQDLCLKVEEFVAFDADKIRDWNNKTQELVDLQKQWDSIGPAPREVAKILNKQFWDNFKTFFNNKSKFFEKLDAARDENLIKKQELIKKAEELKESTDWDNAANQLKALQSEWREIGHVPEKQREVVYQQFKQAADHFFDRRRNRYKEQDAAQEENLNQKLEICSQIEELAKAKSNDTKKLQELHLKFHEFGFVPRKNIRTIQDRFDEVNAMFMKNSELSSDEAQSFHFKTQAKAIKQNPKMAGDFKQSENKLKRKITDLENEINLWQNNIEFFAKSKTADKLREEFNEKIANAKAEIAVIENQIKILTTPPKEEKVEEKKAEEATQEVEANAETSGNNSEN